MPLQVTAIMIGVKDLARSKKFYGEGLGCTIDQDHPNFVSFNLGDGSSSLALYEWGAAAQDAVHGPIVQDVDQVTQDQQGVALPGHRRQVLDGAVQVGDGGHPHGLAG